MSQQELQRIKVIENVVEGRIKVGEAAELLSLSRRQVQRLRQSYRAEDVAWVRQGNRGKEPTNRIDKEVRQKILELARGRYRGFNDTHLTAKVDPGGKGGGEPCHGATNLARGRTFVAAKAALAQVSFAPGAPRTGGRDVANRRQSARLAGNARAEADATRLHRRCHH